MPFQIVRNDITKMQTDAIVNTANPRPVYARGTDAAIYFAAGEEELLASRREIGDIARGQAAITPGFRLPAKYIIHTVGPVWEGGRRGETDILRSCYENSLSLALENGCESIAFPLISTGVYGFPKDLALQVVISAISQFLLREEMMIYLVVYDETATRLSEKLFANVEDYIDGWEDSADAAPMKASTRYESCIDTECSMPLPKAVPIGNAPKKRSLKELLERKQETWTEMLFRLIAEKGATNADIYKKAGLTKKLFSKIKNDPEYHPSKNTVIALAVALELNLDETVDFLSLAGYAFSRSSKFDTIICYCIEEEKYDIVEIEFLLYDMGCKTLCTY